MDDKNAANHSIELVDYEGHHVASAEASGTARDAADMRRMGKRQELHVPMPQRLSCNTTSKLLIMSSSVTLYVVPVRRVGSQHSAALAMQLSRRTPWC